MKHVRYSEKRWDILRERREIAARLIRALRREGLNAYCYGSVARGDVDKDSDVDIVVLQHVPSYRVELALENEGYTFYSRLIVQATPHSVPKAFIYLDPEELQVVTFPLAKMTRKEEEFYRFGGMVGLKEIEENVRVPGVNRQLKLIVPTEDGHIEENVIGRESIVARKLGVSLAIVEERVYMLTRRQEIGRTGVFIKYYVPSHESFEEALRKLSEQTWHLRRLLRSRGVM